MTRKAIIDAQRDYGASGTEVIDIMLKEQISRISIVAEFTNVTVSVMLANIAKCLPKIELVDGSKIIMSTSAARLIAFNYFDHKEMPFDELSLTVGGKFGIALHLDFGRFLFDPFYALRPEMFSNLQLKLTWDEDACNTSVVVNSIGIYADIDDAPVGGNAKGYMRIQDQYSYAMAASGHEFPRLPADEMIKRIIVQPFSDDHSPSAMLTNVKVDIDNGRFLPYDIPAAQHIKSLTKYPDITRKYTLDGAVTAKTLFLPMSEDVGINIEYDGTAFVTAQSLFAVATITGAKVALAASVDIKALTALCSGRLPYHCIPFDFGDEYLVESWLKMDARANFRLDIEASSDADSGDTCTIAIQSVRMY